MAASYPGPSAVGLETAPRGAPAPRHGLGSAAGRRPQPSGRLKHLQVGNRLSEHGRELLAATLTPAELRGLMGSAGGDGRGNGAGLGDVGALQGRSAANRGKRGKGERKGSKRRGKR